MSGIAKERQRRFDSLKMKMQEVNVETWLSLLNQETSNTVWAWIWHWKSDRNPGHPVLVPLTPPEWQQGLAWQDSLVPHQTKSIQLLAAASSSAAHKAHSQSGHINKPQPFCITLKKRITTVQIAIWGGFAPLFLQQSAAKQIRCSNLDPGVLNAVFKDSEQEQETGITADRHKLKNTISTWSVGD